MGDHRIVCIVHDENKVITHVGIGDEKFKVKDVVALINAKTDEKYTFYTLENGKRANVIAKQRSDTGTWYLTTDPDSNEENNLDFLRKC